MSLLITLHSTFFFFYCVMILNESVPSTYAFINYQLHLLMCLITLFNGSKVYYCFNAVFCLSFFSAFLVIFKDLKCWFFGRDWLYFSSSFISCTFTILDLCIRNWLKLCYVDQAVKDNGNEVFVTCKEKQ